MANPFYVQPAQFGQGLQSLAGSVQQFGQQRAEEQRQQEQAEYEQAAKQAMTKAVQSNDPRMMMEVATQYPEVAETMQQLFGFTNEQTKQIATDTYRRALANPESATQIMQGGIAAVEQFGGRPDIMRRDLDMLQRDPESGMRNIQMGFAAAAPDVYKQFFGESQEPTAFMQEMIAAGIEPGSERYKAAVLERYGKGRTIGYDVVEAMNPETGQREYYQVSRTDPGDRVSLGLQVPVDPRVEAQQVKQQAETRQQAQKELTTVNDMLENVNQIISSPGLESWSGIQAIAPVIPGTEQANTDALVERLQSQQFLKNIGQMRGMGALSNAEGQKIASAAAALRRNMTDNAVKAELNRIKTELERARQRIESGNLLPPEERGEMAPNVSASEGRTQADRAANAAADANAINWSDL